jgi:homoprotocatechuate degradation regulator HpaR
MEPVMSERYPDLRPTSRSLPIALLRSRETVMGPIRDMLAQSGVNEQKWRVLRVLQEQGPMELSQLSVAACLMTSSLTRMIKPMENEGLITRTTPPEDRRKSVISIAPAGLELVHAHAEESRAILAAIERKFGTERLETLLNLLEELQEIGARTPK